MPHILVVEDEPSVKIALRDTLESEGYTVDTATDGQTGLRKAKGEGGGLPDLIMLDIVLPRMSGLEVCQQLRAAGIEVPVIMLTARGTPSDAAFGLKLGADDYIPKPFDVNELLARVAAVLRRSRQPVMGRRTVRIGEAEIHFHSLTAFRGGVPLELSSKEFELLEFLVEHRGATVTREQLLHHIWGEHASSISRTVDAHIARLRRKIEPDPKYPRYLITMHRSGYRLVAE